MKRQEVDVWFPGTGRKEEWRATANEYKVSFGSDENVLELGSGDGCTALPTTENQTREDRYRDLGFFYLFFGTSVLAQQQSVHRSMCVHWCGHQAHCITRTYIRVHLTSSTGDRLFFVTRVVRRLPL